MRRRRVYRSRKGRKVFSKRRGSAGRRRKVSFGKMRIGYRM